MSYEPTYIDNGSKRNHVKYGMYLMWTVYRRMQNGCTAILVWKSTEVDIRFVHLQEVGE